MLNLIREGIEKVCESRFVHSRFGEAAISVVETVVDAETPKLAEYVAGKAKEAGISVEPETVAKWLHEGFSGLSSLVRPTSEGSDNA
jgi:hypothetical protein